MATIKIDNFGGIMPSLSPRSLPITGAQVSDNLYQAIVEFRPLSEDTTVGSVAAGTNSLYRIDSSSAWLASSSDRSYVRGQINGDVKKRTFYSTDSSTTTELRSIDTDGVDRILGVPRPAKPETSVVAAPTLTIIELAYAVQCAIANSVENVESRWDAAHSTSFAGPTTTYGLLFRDDTGVVASGVAGSGADLYAKITTTRAAELGIDLTRLGAAESGGFAYVGITCLPATKQWGSLLSTALTILTNTRTSVVAFTAPQVTEIVNAVKGEFDPNHYAPTQKAGLDPLVKQFSELMQSAPVPTVSLTEPTRPTVPTVPRTITETVAVVELTDAGATNYTTVTTDAPEWIAYDAALATYQQDMIEYNSAVAVQGSEMRSITDTLIDLRQQAYNLTVESEQASQRAFAFVAWSIDWALNHMYSMGGSGAIPAIDAERVEEPRFYRVTYVTDRGEESEPSDVSEMQMVDQYASVTITRPTVPSGRYLTIWRVYRSNAGTSRATFQYAADVAIATGTFSDTMESSELGEVCPSLTWLEPEVGLRGLVGMPNGIMAAFKGNTVHFCHPYVPYAWPAEYQITTEHPIVGLGVFGQTLFVGTEGAPYFVSGSDSASMSSLKLDSNQSCVSRKSIAMAQGGVLFASPDGLCVADNNGVSVISRGHYTREDWQALTPSSMFAFEHESIYHLFYNNGVKRALVFDLASKKLGKITDQTTVTAAFVDRVTDQLFVAAGTSIKRVYGAGTRRTAVWRTPLITLPAQAPFAWLKVLGDQSVTFPVTVRWYGDGVLRHTATVTSTAPLRLPAGRWLEHEIEIESKARVTQVMIASTTEELQGV